MSAFKPSLALAAALGFLAFQGIAYAQMPAQQPEAKAFKVGSLDLVSLHDAQFTPANDGKTFGVGQKPEAVADLLKAAGEPTNVVTLSVDALLVKSDKRVVLIDTGIGGALQQSLALSGTKPEAVTDILITHSHPDHVGGLVKDGKLAFPNATIRMSRAEWKYLQGQSNIADLVKAISDKVKPFKAGAEVVPGITSVALPGHTPGHVGYQIVSGKEKLIDIGDTVHSSVVSLAEPKWDVAFDGDHAKAEKSRLKILNRLAKSQEMVFTPHFPFPGVGHVEADGDHFRWAPTLTAQ